MSMRVAIAMLAIMLAKRAQGQPVLTHDPVTKLYTIEYRDESRIRRSVQFQGNNQVVPEVALQVTGASPCLYQYKIGNGGAAKQALFTVSVACEPGTRAPPDFRGLHVWDSASAGRVGPPVHYCEFSLSAPRQGVLGVAPGTKFGNVLTLESEWFPGIRSAEADGMNELPAFPGFRDETPTSITKLYESTQAPLTFMAISPKYPPAVLSNPRAGIAAMADELAQACALGWASPEGVCNSLRVKLTSAKEAASVGDVEAAGRHLETYVSELTAQSGKHVAESFAKAMILDLRFMLGVWR